MVTVLKINSIIKMDLVLLIPNEIIYRPIFNILIIFLSLTWWILWLSIILLTLTIRLILLKPTLAWTKAQKEMTDIQPKLHEIQEKYKDDPQTLSAETMKLMKTHWAGPLKWCLMMLVQIPIFIWLFFVIKNFSEHTITQENWINSLYSFLHWVWYNFLNTEQINHIFLWIDLFNTWNYWIALIAWILMYIQIKMTTMFNKPTMPSVPWMQMPDMSKFMNMMNIFMVVTMMFFVFSMPTWIWFYIITTTIFWIWMFVYQYYELVKVEIKVLASKFQKNK